MTFELEMFEEDLRKIRQGASLPITEESLGWYIENQVVCGPLEVAISKIEVDDLDECDE